MQREDKSQPRRLETPDRGESRQRRDDDRTRSRRSRTRCDSIRSFNERGRLRVVERDLARERDRLHNLQNDLIMERSRRLRSVSKNNDFERHDSHISGRDTSTGRNVRSRSRALDQGVDDRPKRRRILEQGQRSFSPSFSTKDVTNILKSLKDLQSQPSTSAPVAPINSIIGESFIIIVIFIAFKCYKFIISRSKNNSNVSIPTRNDDDNHSISQREDSPIPAPRLREIA
ncbi:unnamed protein product [Parnassius mnemosyne]|uniref:Uncharacterized protein n=1 Tax=Parnassius mnemosyne TaxID=213953 RepID=A0AAV1M9U8_9NEOP